MSEKSKLPNSPNFEILGSSTIKSRDNVSKLKDFTAFYVMNIKEMKILNKSFEIHSAQKILKHYSSEFKKDNNKKTPFLIINYKDKKIISPDLEQNNQILSLINEFERDLDENLGDVISEFKTIFQKK